MSAQLFSRSGPAGQGAVAALVEHLPAEVMARPVVVHEDLVLDEDGAIFGLDEDGAWRRVVLAAGGEEVTWWHQGREVRRAARIECEGR